MRRTPAERLAEKAREKERARQRRLFLARERRKTAKAEREKIEAQRKARLAAGLPWPIPAKEILAAIEASRRAAEEAREAAEADAAAKEAAACARREAWRAMAAEERERARQLDMMRRAEADANA